MKSSFALGALVAVLLCGCGEPAPKVSSADLKAFDSATPEAQKLWQSALAASTTNGHMVAILSLRSLLQSPLSDTQIEAAQNAMRVANTRLMEAVNKGDANAKQVLEELRATTGRGGR